MALKLISEVTNTKRQTKTKARKPINGGVVVQIREWKRRTENHTVESESVVVSAQPSWIDSIVGAFDDNPVYERIMANGRAFRRSLERQVSSE